MGSVSFKNELPDRNLSVELTNICNLKCPLCCTGSGCDKREKGMMDFEKYKRFLDGCSSLLYNINFIGVGESMLHPRFVDFVSYAARKHKKRTKCLSNGGKLRDPFDIIYSGLHEIHFDIDGLTQDQHEKYRVGSSLEKVVRNIKRLVAAKGELKTSYPTILVDTLISRYNENDYSRFIEFAHDLRVDGICFKGIIDDLYQTSDWFPQKKKFRHIRRFTRDCLFKNPYEMAVTWQGDLQLCCLTPHHKEPVIKCNVFSERDFLDTFKSELFQQTTKNAGEYDLCKKCFWTNYSNYQETILF